MARIPPENRGMRAWLPTSCTHARTTRDTRTRATATHDLRDYAGTQESRAYRVTYSSATVAVSKDAAREMQLGLRARAQESLNVVLR